MSECNILGQSGEDTGWPFNDFFLSFFFFYYNAGNKKMMYANEVHQKLEVFMWDRKLNISAEVSGGTKKKGFQRQCFFFFFFYKLWEEKATLDAQTFKKSVMYQPSHRWLYCNRQMPYVLVFWGYLEHHLCSAERTN